MMARRNMTATNEARKSIRQRRYLKVFSGMNTAIAVFLALILVGMCNYLSMRHYHRADWTRSRFYSLSDKTMGLLDSLTNDIRVVVFFEPDHGAFDDVENLLKEYEYNTDRIRIEYVDPYRDLARTEELARKYDVTKENVVVFDIGAKNKYVTLEDIVEFDYSGMEYGQLPEQVAFKGEQAFSSAIQDISQARKPVVYFLEGHGERSIADFDQRTGYSSLNRIMSRDNITVKSLKFGEINAVPDDMDALIVAGPTKRLSQPELDLISHYFSRNGRIIFLLDMDTETGLDVLLEDWGIKIRDDVVVDASRTLTGRELFVTDYGVHPVTEKMTGITTIFYMPRSVEPVPREGDAVDPADKPRAVTLASSSTAGWAESRVNESLLQYDPQEDRAGPISIAVAMERGAAAALDVRIRPTRAVVFGDSGFIANGAMAGGGIDLFMSSLNWVLEREELMAIAPKPVEESRLLLTSYALNFLFWILVAGMPLTVAALGLLVWLRRRR